MDWPSLLERVLSVAVPFVGYKWYFGKKSKRIEFLDRMTKEVALRDALLKLQIAASENGTEQQKAKKTAYDEAQKIEDQLVVERKDRVEEASLEMFGRENFRARVIPERYEGLTLNPVIGARWRKYMTLYWIFLILYCFASGSFLLLAFHRNFLRWPQLLSWLLPTGAMQKANREEPVHTPE